MPKTVFAEHRGVGPQARQVRQNADWECDHRVQVWPEFSGSGWIVPRSFPVDPALTKNGAISSRRCHGRNPISVSILRVEACFKEINLECRLKDRLCVIRMRQLWER